MRRICILLLACICVSGAMAQGQKYKQRIVDRDYYPMDSAKVTVKGTNISTVTDWDGNFVLEHVPLSCDSIEVTKGNKSKTLPMLVNIKMRQSLMDRFSWHVKAGWNLTSAYGDGTWSADGFYAGVGMDFRVSYRGSYELGIFVSRRNVSDAGAEYNYYNLEIPLMYGVKFRLSREAIMSVKFGGYYDYVLSGDYIPGPYSDGEEGYNSSDRSVGGFAVGLGCEIKKKWLVDLLYKTGWVFGGQDWDSSTYMDISMGIGYQF